MDHSSTVVSMSAWLYAPWVRSFGLKCEQKMTHLACLNINESMYLLILSPLCLSNNKMARTLAFYYLEKKIYATEKKFCLQTDRSQWLLPVSIWVFMNIPS